MGYLKVSIVCLTAFMINKCLSKGGEGGSLHPRQLVQPSQSSEQLVPDKCSTSFDAAGFIRGDLVMFKGKYFWQPAKSDEAMEIRSVWPELPTGMTHIDAVHESNGSPNSKRIWFFIGREIYIFDGAKLEVKLSLRDIGIDPEKYSKIDSIFKWPFNNRTYVFSGEDYWKLCGTKVCESYPENIQEVWKETYDTDTVFSFGEKLLFLKDSWYHEFNPSCMQIDRMTHNKTGQTFLGCELEPVVENQPTGISDVIRLLPEKCEEDTNNIEKHNLKRLFRLFEFE